MYRLNQITNHINTRYLACCVFRLWCVMQYFAYFKIITFYMVERAKQALFLFQNGGDAYDCIKAKHKQHKN